MRGRLDGALDEQTVPGAPLRRACDFAALPDQIKLLGANEALARDAILRARRKFALQPGFLKGIADPFVQTAIAFRSSQCVPRIRGRKNQAVGPVGLV